MSCSRLDRQDPSLSSVALNPTRPDRDDCLYPTARCSIPNHTYETHCMRLKFSAKNGECTEEESNCPSPELGASERDLKKGLRVPRWPGRRQSNPISNLRDSGLPGTENRFHSVPPVSIRSLSLPLFNGSFESRLTHLYGLCIYYMRSANSLERPASWTAIVESKRCYR
jgi:hypothetical protein